jgi:hypothetical protein
MMSFRAYVSNAKMRFQSFFILMIVQFCCFAMSYIAWLKVPTLFRRSVVPRRQNPSGGLRLRTG